MKPQMVEVEWIDSAFHRGWGTLGEKRDRMSAAKCRTVGYLLEEGKREIKLAMSLDDDPKDPSAADGITIPRCTVTKLRRLK